MEDNDMTFLAFVTYTALHHADVVFVTREPAECTRETSTASR